MAKPVYKRVLLKISGEALAGDKHTGLDFEVIGQVCDVIKECLDMGVQVGLVVGGGNFWRGAKNSGGAMERTRADHMGMLATVMNCLAVADVCEQKGIPVRVQTAIEMRAVAEPYIRSRAIRHLEKGRVVIFGAGTGNPYFSTDTAAVLRAAEIDADVILLAKNVDGVYTADPVKDPTAVKYDVITYDDVLAQHLAVMDSTATSLSMDNKIPVLSLNELVMEQAEKVKAPCIRPARQKTGSTDFGNVMRHVPGTCIRVAFVPEGAAAHSQEYLDAGKTEAAHDAVVYGAKILALTGVQLIEDPEKLEVIKKEFHENLAQELHGQS